MNTVMKAQIAVDEARTNLLTLSELLSDRAESLMRASMRARRATFVSSSYTRQESAGITKQKSQVDSLARMVARETETVARLQAEMDELVAKEGALL